MHAEVISRWEALPIGRSQWNGLLATSVVDVPFLTWEWQARWWAHFGQSGALRAAVGLDGEEPIAIAPLFLLQESGRPVLRFLGGTDISDYLDVIVAKGREGEAWFAILEALLPQRDWVSLDLHCLPAHSSTLSFLPSIARSLGLTVAQRVEERCPVIDLPPFWDAYLDSLSGKDRHELRRKMRRLEREIPGARIAVIRGREGLERGLEVFIQLHQKSKAGKARFMDGRMQEFFRDAAAFFADEGWLALWLLETEGPVAAALFCYEYRGCVGLYNSGFDPAKAHLSPGVVLIGHAIRDAIERGAWRFDFLRGEEPYKHSFGARPVDLFHLTVERS